MELPLPVRIGAKHSVTALRIGSEPPLPVRMGAKYSYVSMFIDFVIRIFSLNLDEN